jgi:bile acid:Na+ symporter, BASS family
LIGVVIIASITGQWALFVRWLPELGGACLTIMALLIAASLLLGRTFKLRRGETTAISIDSAMQNAVMGITLGSMFVFGPAPYSLASMPSAIYGVLMYLVCLPFVFWRRQTA